MQTNEKLIEFFQQTTGYTPFLYQQRWALENYLPQRVSVPTGMGKTAKAI